MAAAIDFEMIIGKRHGDLARRIADDIKKRRRLELGLDQPPMMPMVLPNSSPEDKRRRELEGGVVIVGRPTFKEFMAGLKKGWTDSLEPVDREEELARTLASDGRFDEPEPDVDSETNFIDTEGEPIPTASRLPPSRPFSPFTPPHLRGSGSSSSHSSEGSSVPPALNVPPPKIPPQPPILFVHFVNHIGLTQIPLMVWDFFNERHKVKAGAEAAYRLIIGETRPFVAPPAEIVSQNVDADLSANALSSIPHPSGSAVTDLDFDKDTESWYKKSTARNFASSIEKARADYYASLPERLETARALSRGLREPTREEKNHPPPTEVELRAERMKKELRWRADEEGWDIVKPEKEVAWDERFRDALRVFTDLPGDVDAFSSTQGKSNGEGAS